MAMYSSIFGSQGDYIMKKDNYFIFEFYPLIKENDFKLH